MLRAQFAIREGGHSRVQLPQGFRAATELAGQDMAREPVGFKNGQSQRVIRLLCLPLKPDALNANEEDSVGDLAGGTTIGGKSDASRGTFFLTEVAVELAN